MPRFALAAILLALGACEAIIGADFDPKRLAEGGAPSTGGAGGEAGQGGGQLLSNGEPCTVAAQCDSGLCVERVCCDAACVGECRSCALPASLGRCTALDAGSPCPISAGECDGSAYCATGEPLFSAVFGSAGRDEARACAFDPLGRLWVAGVFSDSIDFGGQTLSSTQVDQRIFLATFGPDHTHVASQAIGNDEPVSSTTFSVDDMAIDAQGRIALVAHIDGRVEKDGVLIQPTAYADSMLVLGLTPEGSYAWHHLYGSDGPPPALQLAARDGRVVVAGSYGSIDLFDGNGAITAMGARAGFIAAHDVAGGAPIWSSHSSGQPGATPDVFVRDVALSEGGAVLVGQFANAPNGPFATWGGIALVHDGGPDALLVSFDDAGSVLTASRYGDTGTQWGESIAANGGDVALAGSFSSSINIGGDIPHHQGGSPGIDFDGFVGRVRASDHAPAHPGHGFGPGTLSAKSMQIAADDGQNAIFTGRSQGLAVVVDGAPLPVVTAGYFFAKLAADGERFLWAQAFGIEGTHPAPTSGQASLWVRSIATAPDGRIALCGHLADTADVGTGALATQGEEDVWVAIFAP